MQTFLPYPSFIESAKCLDNKRLGKQRVEAYQILNTLLQGPYQTIDSWAPERGSLLKSKRNTPWYNHPAVQMWKGYEGALLDYGNAVCFEWINRGFKDTIKEKLSKLGYSNGSAPPWLGNNKFHASHRSNLLKKDPLYYSKFGWEESNDLPYFWPTKEGY